MSNRIDRSREFSSLLLQARNHFYGQLHFDSTPLVYLDQIHSQFRSLSGSILSQMCSLFDLLYSGPIDSTASVQSKLLNITQEVNRLKSFQVSFADSCQLFSIPPLYSEHTLNICKILEGSCRALAMLFKTRFSSPSSALNLPSEQPTKQQILPIQSQVPPALRGRYLHASPLTTEETVRSFSPSRNTLILSQQNTGTSGKLESIESTLQELGSAFQQLVQLISIQGEVVQRIDMDIENAFSDAQVAQRELFQFWKNEDSNRGLMLKAFAAVLLGTFFVFFFLVQ